MFTDFIINVRREQRVSQDNPSALVISTRPDLFWVFCTIRVKLEEHLDFWSPEIKSPKRLLTDITDDIC